MVGLPDGAQPAAAPAGASTPLTGAPGATPAPAGNTPGGLSVMLPMVLVLGALILMQVFMGRKERKRRDEMMSSMKKGDRVQTSGGVIATIMEIHDDDVLLRLEEGKMRVTRAAISGVVKSAKGGPEDKPEVIVKTGREKASV